jgi:dTDP-4-amino-4,6-dideoxygalactose transaminase
VPVPYFRLEATDAERRAVDEVLQSGWLTTGAACKAFEFEFAVALGGQIEAIAVNSNTAGLHLVLEAMGIGRGDEVIVPSLTFTATAEVVRYVGADVRFTDVCPDTLCIDPQNIEKAITSKTKAIMVVHFGGLPANMPVIVQLAKKHGLRVIEDAAHAFPASIAGVPVGKTGGDATVFSFYANKTMTTGEGGMIVTSDKKLADRCRVMRLHGIDRDAFARFTSNSMQWRYDVVAPGYKYNLTDLAAALGREQLKFAEENRRIRQSIAESYRKAFTGLPMALPTHGIDHIHAWHLYPITVPREKPHLRDELATWLKTHGIGFSVHYTPLHQMTYWQRLYSLDATQFPISETHGNLTLSLPIFPAMRFDETSDVIDCVQCFWGNVRD